MRRAERAARFRELRLIIRVHSGDRVMILVSQETLYVCRALDRPVRRNVVTPSQAVYPAVCPSNP